MKTILSAAAIAAALLGTASAQEAHGSIGLIVNEGFDDVGVAGRFGYDFTSYLGVEGELNYYSADEDSIDGAGDLDVDADIFGYFAFAKAQAPVGERVTLFGRAGYGGVTVDVDVEGFGSESESEGAFAYGVGAEFAVTPSGAIRADYTRIDLGDDFGDEGFLSVSYAFRFGGGR